MRIIQSKRGEKEKEERGGDKKTNEEKFMVSIIMWKMYDAFQLYSKSFILVH